MKALVQQGRQGILPSSRPIMTVAMTVATDLNGCWICREDLHDREEQVTTNVVTKVGIPRHIATISTVAM